MKPYIGWSIVVCVMVGLFAAFVIWMQPPADAFPSVSFATTTSSSSSPTATTFDVARTPPAGYKEYRNTDYGFSVFYPENLPPTEYKDRGFALTVSFQSEAGKEGFQIYVAPINLPRLASGEAGGAKVSAERFKLDAPSGVMKNQERTSVDGAEAIAFEGLDYGIGETHEVWFIHGDPARPDDGQGGFLFEVTTYKELEEWLSAIMETWQFI